MATVEMDYEYRSRSATALNELAILDQMGREGWEVIDLGPLNLHYRRPRVRAAVVPWEYARRTALPGAHARFAERAQGWECTSGWVLFHDLKRPRIGAY